MPRRAKLTKTDREFLRSVSEALSSYKESQTGCTNASLAAYLGVEESTVAKYISMKSPIMGEVLARACVDLGISFNYKGHLISAASFPAIPTTVPEPATQLEFLFDAGYSAGKNSWRMTQRHAEPMEFTLHIKMAS